MATTTLTAEQKQNAALIRDIGQQTGRSTRDITIAIATALQESSLKNLKGGDRDSAGLFQQRPSQGWGTLAQVTDPQYSIRKFYTELAKVQNRNQLTVAQAAQKVQRSAYPDAYAKWEGLASQLALGKDYDAPIVKTAIPAQRPTSVNDDADRARRQAIADRATADAKKYTGEANSTANQLLLGQNPVTAPFEGIADNVSDPNFWLRLAFIGGGLFLMMVAVIIFLSGNKTVQNAATTAAVA